LLGAELTQRQGLIFRYLARLLIEIPGATIHTLRDLMENGEQYLPYMKELEGTTRDFFATRFFDPTFRETKKQILSRLWGVLSNRALERMFSHKESKIDLFDLLNSGKIIFINTAKDLLGQDGAAIFGRFFIALIAQAAVQRSAIPSHQRSPAFVYIDEAADYFDENIGNLLTQARKYKVGLIFAHQSMDQLSPELRSSVLSNTSIKFAGGVSAKDASLLAGEMRTAPDLLLAQKRGKTETFFAVSVKNHTHGALSLSVPLGYVGSLPRLSDNDAELLRDMNRREYCAPPDVVAEAEFTLAKKRAAPTEPAPTPVPPILKTRDPIVVEPIAPTEPPNIKDMRKAKAMPVPPPQPGRGGREHKYLQQLIKGLAEERGYRATIEEQILDGDGEVDVSLQRGKRKIAVEISVTTGTDHELGNIEKGIAAGYKEILFVSGKERHARSLARAIKERIDEETQANISISYAAPETLGTFLESLGETIPPSETEVAGYRVKTTRKAPPPEDAARRRAVIADVVARSLSADRETK
jgi:hypothetical protein